MSGTVPSLTQKPAVDDSEKICYNKDIKKGGARLCCI